MADTFSKKEREKKKRKRKEEKAARRELKRNDEFEKGNQIMYVDEFGNFSETPPEPAKKVKKEDINVSVPTKEEWDQVESTRNGRVKFFNQEKGYGFIVDDETGDSYFTHANNLLDQIADNDAVTFELGSGPKGPVAIEVKLRS